MDPARVRRPKDKPKVENQVKYVRGDWFSGEEFRDLQQAREHARHWCGQEAGRRIHGTTHKQPREVYEQREMSSMQPPPTEVFDVPQWGKATVRRDCHVYVERALYSVSYLLVGKEVRTRADRSLVKILYNHQAIKVHARQPAGGRSTDVNDYDDRALIREGSMPAFTWLCAALLPISACISARPISPCLLYSSIGFLTLARA